MVGVANALLSLAGEAKTGFGFLAVWSQHA